MDKNLESAFSEIDRMWRPDLNDLETSLGYKVLESNSESYCTIEEMLQWKEVMVSGDVRGIVIKVLNEVYLDITYSLRTDILHKEQRTLFEVTDEQQKQFIREKLLPDTGIEFIARYTGKSGLGEARFEAVDFISINQKLNFGFYICNGDNPDEESGAVHCHENFGYNTNIFDKGRCCLCGSSLRYVDTVY